jgi:hypothetical protein
LRDRCGACSEGFASQCVYFTDHAELHRFGPMLPWPPPYYKCFEEETNEDDTYGAG